MSAENIIKKLFCIILALGVCLFSTNVYAENLDCPDCLDEYDGSLFPGGSCKNCIDRTKSNKKVRIVDPNRRCGSCPTPVFQTVNYRFAQARYKHLDDRECCNLASFALTHVDFKLNNTGGYNPYSSHVGNYRFRIFGCRRQSKKALLNQGRLIQKNMMFNEIFKDSIDKCYKVMDIPSDVCLADTSVGLPEYTLTAEITNFFMNVCDEFDWNKSQKKNKRNGSAEMTVTWRLMNLSQTKVLWKGVTTGYAEVEDGTYEGEIQLTEEAFADAAARLSSLVGFEEQLKVRPTSEQMAHERAYLVAYDEKVHPGKCYFKKEIAYTHSCGYAPQPQCPALMRPACPCANPAPCMCNQPVCACPIQACPCALGKPKVEEFVDVKTEKETRTIERKIITTTRVETPQPVCQQVCRPVCPQKKITTVEKREIIETVEETPCPMSCSQECEQPKCRNVCTKTCVEGTNECTETCKQDCGEEKPIPAPKVETKIEEIDYYKAPIEEKGGVEVENITVVPEVEETGGIEDSHRIYENCIDENGNVISDGSCAMVDDSWIDFEGYSVDSKLCVVDRPPYNELSPENMLEIRKSIVEIENAKGQKGIGLVISDSFVLTSASLVNKLNNQYDVKTMSGDKLKARAVRYNPSKNTALLVLDKPVTVVPLSLNMDLPAIDQEGFISLGLLGTNATEKNYMDDSGKIYGYRYSDNVGTEIIVDTLVQKVSVGSVLIDRLGTINGMSNSANQTKDGMDLFIPTETALRSVGVSVCEKIYEKKSPWEKPVYKPVTEKVTKIEQVAPEAMSPADRK